MAEHLAARALAPARAEGRDVGFRLILLLLGGIGCALLLLIGVAYVIYPGAVTDTRFAQPFPDFPKPSLQPSPALDWTIFYASEMQWLNGTGWIDKAAGTVHIPIDQAMRDVAGAGIPGWPAGNPHVSQGDRR